MKSLFHLLLITALLSTGACKKATDDLSPNDPTSQKGVVKGRVVDSQGKGVPNAEIIATGTDDILRASTGYTDANGNYAFKVPTGIGAGSYSVSGTVTLKYQGRNFKLALYEEDTRVFSAYDGAVRNFQFRLTGKRTVDSEEDPQRSTPLGGQIEVHHQVDNVNKDNLEITLEPVGALVDGSTGKKLVTTLPANDYRVYDIPVGQYKITARDKVTGQKLGVTIKDSSKDYAASVTALFKEMDFEGDTRYELILLVDTL